MQDILSPVSCMRVRDGSLTSLPLISVRTKPILSDDQFFFPRKFEMIHYGDQAIDIVSNNPYQLATDIYGIGFITADTIARHVGFAPDSPFRYQAGITHVLSGAAEDGHCFLPHGELARRAVSQLALPDHPVEPVRITELLGQMAEAKQLIIQSGYGDLHDQQICYTPAFYHTEQALANRLAAFATAPVEVDLPVSSAGSRGIHRKWGSRYRTSNGWRWNWPPPRACWS
jgi:ATP-dependent exoDNAse (exonuclease V) alpha subunit